jgi:Holliday junction DNA helicase RuvB
VQQAFSSLGIDRIGLAEFDRDLLKTIIEKFSGGPVGIENFAAKLGESPWNIEEIHEPYLIEIGFLKRTPRGRIATRQAHEYLGYQYAVGKAPQKLAGPKVARSQKKLL